MHRPSGSIELTDLSRHFVSGISRVRFIDIMNAVEKLQRDSKVNYDGITIWNIDCDQLPESTFPTR
jgi:hypothetical protein